MDTTESGMSIKRRVKTRVQKKKLYKNNNDDICYQYRKKGF